MPEPFLAHKHPYYESQIRIAALEEMLRVAQERIDALEQALSVVWQEASAASQA